MPKLDFFSGDLAIGLLCTLIGGYAIGETLGQIITFQAKESTATVSNPSKCPGRPDFTMSVSSWNQGGWPLFRITCYYKEAK